MGSWKETLNVGQKMVEELRKRSSGESKKTSNCEDLRLTEQAPIGKPKMVMVETRNLSLSLVLVTVVTLFSYLSSRVPVNVVQMCGDGLNHTDPTNLIWVITSGNLHLINQVALESIFLHNPTASLVIHLREGMENKDVEAITFAVQRFIKDGYQVKIRQYNFRNLLSAVSSEQKGVLNPSLVEDFLEMLPQIEEGEFWTYSHQSNFVRMLILLHQGGIYLDTDIVLTKKLPMSKIQNAIAYEMYDGGRLNNNVLIFERGHPFLVECLNQMFQRYNPKCEYTHSGPDLVTKVHKTFTGNLAVLSAKNFQPVDLEWMSKGMFTEMMHSPENLEYRKIIARQSYGVHFNNKLTRDFTLEKGTLAHHILASNCLYCEQMK